MHIIVFLNRKTRGNTSCSTGQETYTNFCAYLLAWVMAHNFHKIIENPNCNFASHKYKNGYLLGRHVSNGSLHKRNKHVPRQSNLLFTTSGFCNQLEKVSLTPVQEINILGLKINSVNLEISVAEEIIQKVKPATSILELR